MAFPPVYCINLKRRPDRWAEVTQEAELAGIELIRVEAVDGADPSNHKMITDRRRSETQFRNDREVAVWLSHLQAIEAAYAAEQPTDAGTQPANSEYVIVVEDDVVFLPGFKERLPALLKSTPKQMSLFYVGYLRYSHSVLDPDSKGKKWLKMSPVYGLHCYAIRRVVLPELIKFMRNCDGPVDDYIASNWKKYVVAAQPLAYQRLETASDITGWPGVCNPFNNHAWNPLCLKYLWQLPGKGGIGSRYYHAEPIARNEKVLHVLPGQRLYFEPGPEWRVQKWESWDDLFEYKRFGKKIPFAWWAVYLHGGMAFPGELTPWLDKYWGAEAATVESDRVIGSKGHPVIESKIYDIVAKYIPDHEGGRWGSLPAQREVAPDYP